MDNISYFNHESTLVHMERTNKRLFILCLVLIISLIGTNAGWIYYESQWEYIQQSTQIEAEQEGDINIIGGGDVTYGAKDKGQ